MEPTTVEDWIAVANERAADVWAMLAERDRSTRPVYVAGYVIECSLKAYLQRLGIGFPKRGREGHDVSALWSTAGFRITDLHDADGSKTFYIESWSTDLRYEVVVDSTASVEDLVTGAGQLTGWIQSQIRRARRSR